MWSQMLEVAKKSPFGSPISTAKCQGQDDMKQSLVKNRYIAAADALPGGKIETFIYLFIQQNNNRVPFACETVKHHMGK